jgi:hypothetical protein
MNLPFDYRKPVGTLPNHIDDGEVAIFLARPKVEKNDEEYIGIKLVLNRRLFGQVYEDLLPDHYASISQNGGVLIAVFTPSAIISRSINFPGDIDLLVIPFEGDDLILSKTLAVELKVVRATYKRQGKSPNEFGFSQAQGLWKLGFPYVAVTHLIVSDNCPPNGWREVLVTEIIDAESGRCNLPRPVIADVMPSDLVWRSYGRLKSNNPNPAIGISAAYIDDDFDWQPLGSRASPNPTPSKSLLDRVAEFYYSFPECFLLTWKFPQNI